MLQDGGSAVWHLQEEITCFREVWVSWEPVLDDIEFVAPYNWHNFKSKLEVGSFNLDIS
jgi:hypothetical protein